MAAQITAIFLFIGFPLRTVGVVINIVGKADSDPGAIYQSKNTVIICTYDQSINITIATLTDSRGKAAQRDLELTLRLFISVRLENCVYGKD